MNKPRLVIVGNGMAGVRTLQELLKIAPGQHDITVFGAEPHPHYDRAQLGPLLNGEQTVSQIVLRPASWYAEHGVRLRLGDPVVSVNRVLREVRAEDGCVADYDRLLIATGSRPVLLPVPGRQLDGVLAYRDLADALLMVDAARHHRHAVVIGAGLLGLEAATGLARRGMSTTVVAVADGTPAGPVAPAAATSLQGALQRRGVAFETTAQVQRLVGDRYHGQGGRVVAVHLSDGRLLRADLVVMAVGSRPDTELARAMGLHCGPDGQGGISVNDTLQTTTDARIYAVGECAAHRGVGHGLMAPLLEQARVCATHLAQWGIGRFTGGLPAAGAAAVRQPDNGPADEDAALADRPDGGWHLKLLDAVRKLGEPRDQADVPDPAMPARSA